MKLLRGLLVGAILISLSIINVEARIIPKGPITGPITYTVPDEFSFNYSSPWFSLENTDPNIDAILTYGPAGNAYMMFQGGSKDQLGLTGSDSELIDSLASMVVSTSEAAALSEIGSGVYEINNRSASYVIGTYIEGLSYDPLTGEPTGINHDVMLVAVPLNEDQIVLVSYDTIIDNFGRYLPNVEQIFKSITPVNSTGNQ